MSETKQTKYFIIAGGIALVVVLAFLLFGFPKQPEKVSKVEYNYFTFEEIGGMWQTTIKVRDNVYEVIFRFNPEQVQDVYVTGDFAGFGRDPVYITFDPDANPDEFKYLALASSELSLHLIRALNVSVIAACTKNVTDACIDRPVVTCSDRDKNVVYLVAKPPTQITLDERCITLNGEGLELLKSVDRILFPWYKIMR